MANVKVMKGSDTDKSALNTPSDLPAEATKVIAESLNKLAADAFTLYVKTKNFHWHMTGPHFRDYHLLLDEQADQIFASIDPLAERCRKLGQPTLHSLAEIAKLSRIKDNGREFVSPYDMLCELVEDNKGMAAAMRGAHELCEDKKDPGSASLLEVFIDETERRTWFLFEAARGSDPSGH